MGSNNHKIGILGGIALFLASGSSQAVLMADPNLTYGDANYLGFIGDGIPSSLSMEVSYINNLNGLSIPGPSDPQTVDIGSETYSRVDSSLPGPFDDAVLLGADKDEGVNDIDSSTQQAGTYQYVLGKYDGRNYGSLVWYNADGFTGNITLQGTAGSGTTGQYALSHISFFNSSTSVPAPSTVLLFGLGMLGLRFLKRGR